MINRQTLVNTVVGAGDKRYSALPDSRALAETGKRLSPVEHLSSLADALKYVGGSAGHHHHFRPVRYAGAGMRSSEADVAGSPVPRRSRDSRRGCLAAS